MTCPHLQQTSLSVLIVRSPLRACLLLQALQLKWNVMEFQYVGLRALFKRCDLSGLTVASRGLWQLGIVTGLSHSELLHTQISFLGFRCHINRSEKWFKLKKKKMQQQISLWFLLSRLWLAILWGHCHDLHRTEFRPKCDRQLPVWSKEKPSCSIEIRSVFSEMEHAYCYTDNGTHIVTQIMEHAYCYTDNGTCVLLHR